MPSIPWDELASGITTPYASGVEPMHPNIDLPAIAPTPTEPFLCVDVDWGDGTVSHFGEIDRPTGSCQIRAKVLDIGPIRRAFAPDHSVQRTAATLVLENVSGEIGQRIRSAGWAAARLRFWIGFPELARADWQPIAGRFRIDTAPEITAERVTLQLVDDVTAATDQRIRLLDLTALRQHTISPDTVRTIHNGPSYTDADGEHFDWDFGTFRKMQVNYDGGWWLGESIFPKGPPPATFPDTDDGTKIPIPYGPTFAKPSFVWAGDLVAGRDSSLKQRQAPTNPCVAIVLGASRDASWMQPRFWCGRGHGDGAVCKHDDVRVYVERDGLLMPWLAHGPPSNASPSLETANSLWMGAYPDNGICTYIDVIEVPVDHGTEAPDPHQVADRASWWVAVLYVAAISWPGEKQAKAFGTWIQVLQKAIENDGVWIQFAGMCHNGAAGSYPRIDAARVAYHVLRYHTDGDPALLDDASFEEAGSSDLLRGTTCAGTIDTEVQALDVVNGIAKSHGIDLFYTRAGTVACHPPGFTTRDHLQRIPAAYHFDDYRDVLQGSFRVWQPTGDERNGYGTVFHIEGIREPLKKFLEEVEETAWDYATAADGYRRIDRTIDASWLDPIAIRFTDKEVVDEWSRAYRTPRWMAGFTLSLRGLRLDLRDLLRLTHWAGPTEEGERGWRDRLLRVEAVTVDWKRRAIDFECLDADYVTKLRPYILDDEELWKKLRGGPSTSVQLVSGDDHIECVGFDPEKIAAIGDILWIQGQYAGRVYAVHDARLYVIPVPDVDLVTSAFEIQAGRTSTGRPAIYGALAGDAGTYSDGTTGHQLTEA